MKTLILISLAIGLTTLNSCNQKIDINSILENPETRMEILNTVASNHSYMTEFMGIMRESDHAMQMMQGNQRMMGKYDERPRNADDDEGQHDDEKHDAAHDERWKDDGQHDADDARKGHDERRLHGVL